jgi:hypothetical protein
MNKGYELKMGAMAFVAALFNVSVIPRVVMHSCIAELLQGVRTATAYSVGPRAVPLGSKVQPFNVQLMPLSTFFRAKCLQGDSSRAHDLDCLHLLLSAAGPRLQAASEESAAALQGYMDAIQKLIPSGGCLLRQQEAAWFGPLTHCAGAAAAMFLRFALS